MMTTAPSPYDAIHKEEQTKISDLCGISINIDPEKRTPWERRLHRTWLDSPTEWTVGQCRGCGRPLEQPEQQPEPPSGTIFDGLQSWATTICKDCDELAGPHYAGETDDKTHIAGTTPWWSSDEGCPYRIKQAIADRKIERIDWQRVDYAINWNFEQAQRGLILLGNTATGKTTALWALAERIEKLDRKPVVISSIEMSRRLSQSARDIKQDKGLANCKYLLIDDLGKEKMTPAIAATFYELVDIRLTYGRFMVFTTRFDGARLQARFGEDSLGSDIRRRLGDACKVVMFRVKNDKTGEWEISPPEAD